MMENPLLWEVFCGLLTCVLLGNEKKSMKSANISNFCANFARLKAPSNINGLLYTPFAPIVASGDLQPFCGVGATFSGSSKDPSRPQLSGDRNPQGGGPV